MLEIKRFIFGPFETNTYVVSINPPLSAASPLINSPLILLIDPACSNAHEQQQLLDYINSLPLREGSGLGSLTILATHGHLDHLWGAKWATDLWHVPVLMHEADIPMAKAMQTQYDLFGIRRTAEPFPIEKISNLKSKILNVSILSTPGHTPGSICLYFPEEKILLSGDTLFQSGYGRTDLPGGDTSRLFASLRRLATLPPDTQVLPGHGDFTTIGSEFRQ